MNKEKMLQIANLLEKAEPEQFHMGAWFGELMPACEVSYYDIISDLIGEEDLIPNGIDFSDLPDVNVFDKTGDVLSLSCNTTACIAGWAIANEFFNGNTQPFDLLSTNNAFADTLGAEILGLNSDQASRLFFCNLSSVWYEHYEEYGFDFDPAMTETWKIHPKHAADVLRRIANDEISLDYKNLEY